MAERLPLEPGERETPTGMPLPSTEELASMSETITDVVQRINEFIAAGRTSCPIHATEVAELSTLALLGLRLLESSAKDPDPDELRAMAELIWNTSRTDESTISATGANIVARTLLEAGWRRL